ncbi:hypothetical protein [Piscinibacter sp. XHJ-5]|uniref:hypothetical protein n=1 Tax=Piscinibacter sp. XHJ-5 TaxID=3037797 RepID=UPI002452846F|nr:hypothetical protein [Piscinibacter sp. XHJ-5]
MNTVLQYASQHREGAGPSHGLPRRHGAAPDLTSVAPTMVSGNTNGRVMAMAWHAADAIPQARPTRRPPIFVKELA